MHVWSIMCKVFGFLCPKAPSCAKGTSARAISHETHKRPRPVAWVGLPTFNGSSYKGINCSVHLPRFPVWRIIIRSAPERHSSNPSFATSTTVASEKPTLLLTSGPALRKALIMSLEKPKPSMSTRNFPGPASASLKIILAFLARHGIP